MNGVLYLPSVTICIVTYNSQKCINECLDAVFNQGWPRIDVVVVDNASTDATLSLMSQYEKIRIIENKINVGFAEGQNQAINSVESDYYLVLNPDVILSPNYISQLVNFLEDHSEYGSATGCLLLASRPQIIDSTGLEMNWLRRAKDRGAGKNRKDFLKDTDIFGVSGAAAMYARRMIEHISIDEEFFDALFFAYKEDVDVAWRAQRFGWKSRYVQSAIATHERNWGSFSSRSHIPIFVRVHSYHNRYRMLINNENFTVGWILKLPIQLMYELLFHAYLLWKDPKVFTSLAVLPKIIKEQKNKRKKIKEKARWSEDA
ncbi:glycosyltransferase family 2 protein [Cohnella sp. GCM10012308]|uniref:glycosyltransferase family 2 protein n=1 Tax=Cohnella sp. GCM10012308 TaxID=3317329 RepID=UPI00361DDD71